MMKGRIPVGGAVSSGLGWKFMCEGSGKILAEILGSEINKVNFI